MGAECRVGSFTDATRLRCSVPIKFRGKCTTQPPRPMSNFDQRYERSGTAGETNPRLNNTMTNLKISANDTPACEMNRGGVSPITSPHTPTIVWGAMSLLAVIVFTIIGEWIPAIFFVLLGVRKTNSGLKSAKRRKPQYLPRF